MWAGNSCKLKIHKQAQSKRTEMLSHDAIQEEEKWLIRWDRWKFRINFQVSDLIIPQILKRQNKYKADRINKKGGEQNARIIKTKTSGKNNPNAEF